MPVRIRLARHGQRNTPLYHIVAINSTKRRDARPLEKLGEYDPIPRIPEGTKLPPSAQIFYNAASSSATGEAGSSSSSSASAAASSSSSSFKTTGQRNSANNGPMFEGVVKEKRIEWNVERIKYWLGTGAQPSNSVVRLLEKGGVLTVPHPWQHKYSPPSPEGIAAAPQIGKMRNPFAPQPKAAHAAGNPSRASSTAEQTASETSSSPGGITDAAGENTGFAGVTAT